MLVEQFFYIDYDKISIFPEKNIGKRLTKMDKLIYLARKFFGIFGILPPP